MKMFTCVAGALMVLGAVSTKAAAITAATPPMGWNSWNHFAEKVGDRDIRAAADALVASGMRDAGYVYVNIDDGWQDKRDASGEIHPNAKFPDMKALADYVHSRGLRLGTPITLENSQPILMKEHDVLLVRLDKPVRIGG